MGISERVAFIPTAVGGTAIGAWLPPIGTQWVAMVETVDAAMASAGPNAVLRGMIWVQVWGSTGQVWTGVGEDNGRNCVRYLSRG